MAAVVVPASRAENADAEALMSQAGVDFKALDALGLEDFDAKGLVIDLMTGNAGFGNGIVEQLGTGFRTAMWENLRDTIGALIGPAALCAVLGMAAGRRGGFRVATLVCTCCVAGALLGNLSAAGDAVRQLSGKASGIVNALAPMLAASAALGGANAAAAALPPLAAECADILENVIGGIALPICGAAGAIAVAGSLSDGFRLERLFALARGAVQWILGIGMFAFTALLGTQGAMAPARDGAAMRAAQAALESAVPIVGGDVSRVAGSAVAGAGLLSRAMGITGVAAVAAACVGPLIKIASNMAIVRLSAAVLEPIADDVVVRLVGRFGDILELMLACGVVSALLAAILMGGWVTMVTGFLS